MNASRQNKCKTSSSDNKKKETKRRNQLFNIEKQEN